MRHNIGTSKMLQTHANTSTDYVYNNRANIIIYDLTRARNATKQNVKCTIIPVYQNAYN